MRWLIYSREHNAWWNPGEAGYTTIVYNAGRYTFAQAMKICAAANIACPHDNQDEFMMLAPEDAIKVAEAFERGYNQGRRETVEEDANT